MKEIYKISYATERMRKAFFVAFLWSFYTLIGGLISIIPNFFEVQPKIIQTAVLYGAIWSNIVDLLLYLPKENWTLAWIPILFLLAVILLTLKVKLYILLGIMGLGVLLPRFYIETRRNG